MPISLRSITLYAVASLTVGAPLVCLAQDQVTIDVSPDEKRTIVKARCGKMSFQELVNNKECLKIWLDDEAVANQKVNVSFTLTASGDETDSDEQYKLGTSLELSKGTYPQQFKFVTEAGIRLDDDELEENVSRLAVTFDRYLTPRLEGWLFAVRTTDSFMSIDQRYEVGLGLDAEWWVGLGALGERSVCRQLGQLDPSELNREAVTASSLGDVDLTTEKLLSRDHRPLLAAGPSDYARSLEARARMEVGEPEVDIDFLKTYCDNRRGILKRRAALILSLGAEVFAEFEQPEPLMAFVNRRGADGTLTEAAERTEVPLPAEQRLRWALRPSVTWRPSENLSFRGRIYFKFPLDSPRQVDGEDDTRLDSEFQMKYDITESGKGAITLDLNYRHDEIPPSIDIDYARERLGDDIEIVDPIEAESSHWIFKLGFMFKLT